MSPAAGTLLAGRFRVEEGPSREGASGTVLPAVDEETGRPVAVKLLHPHLADDPLALERLQAEARIASRLEHPHLLPVLGLWSHEGRWLLVTGRVSGESLDQVLQTPLAPRAVAALGEELAQALAVAHGQGVVHGDVRPGAVLAGPQGTMLQGFGALAPGGVPLRPGETAPEVQLGAPPGVPADLYGLGVVLHRALTGRAPFEGPSPWAVLSRQRGGPPPPPPGPKGLVRLVQALLHPDPTRRPASAALVARLLGRLVENPARRVRLPHRWASVHPGRGWAVTGTDPATGGPALIRAGLSRRQARMLTAHLSAHGWQVQAQREALSLRSILLVGVTTLVGAGVVPLLGAVFGLITARLLSGRCTPGLRQALPPVRTRLPPWPEDRSAPVVLAGGLLLATALLLLLWPEGALVTMVLAFLALGAVVARRRVDLLAEAARARVETTLLDARRRLESRFDDDRALAALGELEALEHRWRAGLEPEDAVLLRAEAAIEALPEDAGPTARGAEQAMEALRRTRRELERDAPPT